MTLIFSAFTALIIDRNYRLIVWFGLIHSIHEFGCHGCVLMNSDLWLRTSHARQSCRTNVLWQLSRLKSVQYLTFSVITANDSRTKRTAFHLKRTAEISFSGDARRSATASTHHQTIYPYRAEFSQFLSLIFAAGKESLLIHPKQTFFAINTHQHQTNFCDCQLLTEFSTFNRSSLLSSQVSR